ncbi:DUF1572 family protein [Confluentibacter sediminis]|uniref:DUF1572 family protein n=1 Tax=Confluentibacter sediminis TaxID=2219045 RepID=UPI000DAB3CCF|nr:DUF1572 family protein [Confluentibacter sediminis]
MSSSFLTSAIKQFEYYKSLGDKTFNQLTFKELQKEFIEDSNSISIIVKHMVGNMLSRWTNFLTEDGEKEWRQRDAEFEDTYKSKEELITDWDKGWCCLFHALNELTATDLERIVYIRNQGHTVMEAINRQLSHYPYHVGQIVFLGKLIKGNQWQSLSIPKGNSKSYNEDKFSKEKGKRHFTDDL